MIKLSEQAWSKKDLLNGLKIIPKIATQSQEIPSAFLHFDCLQDNLIFMTDGFFLCPTWAEFMFCDANAVETVRTITIGRKKCFSELQSMFVGYKQF